MKTKKSGLARLKARMDAEDREMKRKGQRLLSRKEALGEYAKHLSSR